MPPIIGTAMRCISSALSDSLVGIKRSPKQDARASSSSSAVEKLLLSGPASRLRLFIRNLHSSSAPSLYRCLEALARFHYPAGDRAHDLVPFPCRLNFSALIEEVWFAIDSLVKERGFELPVPPEEG
jgi:hypothetical protein